MVYPGSGDRALRVNLISIVNDAVDRIGDLETTVSSLDDTYVAKTDYSTFVSSTNSSLSTINTTLGNCAKTNTTNTFTKAITFNSTTNTKGNATFGTNIIKSTTASDPSTATLTHVLNKGENDKLYAPITLSDTVSSLETDITTVSTVIADHQTDTSLHVSSSEKEGIASLVANKDNFANKTEDTTFAKSVTVTGGATFDSTITKSNNTTSPTNTTVLNKGETDALYAPKSLSTTVTNLSNTVNGLGSTYVAKTTYDSFVTSTNNSISTINTNVGKCALKTDLNSYVKSADLTTTLGDYVTNGGLTTTLGSYAKTTDLSAYAKVGSANTFTGANTFNSTTTTKGNATFNSNIIRSTTSSTPSSLNDTYVLNKGENNKLYAPASLSTTVSDHTGSSSLHLNSTQIADLTTFNTNKNNYLLKATANSTYAPIALSTTVSSHTSDTTVHLTSTEHTNLTTLISNKDNYANKTAATTFSKTLGVTGATTLSSTLTVTGATTLNGNLTANGTTEFKGVVTKSNSASLGDTSVLNRKESDTRNDGRYAPKSHVSDTSVHMSAADRETLTEVIEIAEELTTTAADFAKKNVENTFVKPNTFKESITTEGGINAMGGDIFVANGVITFEDLVDGTVVERSGASGYQYVEGIPTKFNNGVCYDIGTISNTTNLSAITFSSEGRLVQTCELWFKTPATVPTTHKWPANIYWIDSATGAAPTLIASKNYRLVFRQEPNKIIASIAYLY
jgi:hypothetical protein